MLTGGKCIMLLCSHKILFYCKIVGREVSHESLLLSIKFLLSLILSDINATHCHDDEKVLNELKKLSLQLPIDVSFLRLNFCFIVR